MHYATQVFLVVIFSTTPITQLQWGKIQADDMVSEIQALVMPEVKNFAAVGIGIVAAYLLVRSFKG